MIEQFFDEPIQKIGDHEYSLDEVDDFIDWFEFEDPEPSDMNSRELTIYNFWKENH